MSPFAAFLLAMSIMLILSLMVVVGFFLGIRRNNLRRNYEVEALLEELSQQEGTEKQEFTKKTILAKDGLLKEPWERDSNWWKDR